MDRQALNVGFWDVEDGAAHRRGGQCLDPRTVGLVGRPSRTAPGEVIWAFPASDVPWGGVADAP